MELDGLGMKEVVGEFTAMQLEATYFQGSEPIDAIWATGDLTVANACMLPVGFDIGDHQLFAIDFATATLVGAGLRRLNTKCRVVQQNAEKEHHSPSLAGTDGGSSFFQQIQRSCGCKTESV